MSLDEIEQTKVTATFLNGVALTFVGAGFVTPLVALSYDLAGPAGRSGLAVFIGLAWLGGRSLHTSHREASAAEAAAVTSYELYVAVGLPAIGIALAGGLYLLFGRPVPAKVEPPPRG